VKTARLVKQDLPTIVRA